MRANVNDWRARMLVTGVGMLILSLVLVVTEIERFRFIPFENHGLEMILCAFAVGYSLYAGIALPLLGNAFGRLKASAKMGEA